MRIYFHKLNEFFTINNPVALFTSGQRDRFTFPISMQMVGRGTFHQSLNLQKLFTLEKKAFTIAFLERKSNRRAAIAEKAKWKQISNTQKKNKNR